MATTTAASFLRSGGRVQGGPYSDESENELRTQLAWLAVEAYRREQISQGRLRELAGKLEISAAELIAVDETAHAV